MARGLRRGCRHRRVRSATAGAARAWSTTQVNSLTLKAHAGGLTLRSRPGQNCGSPRFAGGKPRDSTPLNRFFVEQSQIKEAQEQATSLAAPVRPWKYRCRDPGNSGLPVRPRAGPRKTRFREAARAARRASRDATDPWLPPESGGPWPREPSRGAAHEPGAHGRWTRGGRSLARGMLPTCVMQVRCPQCRVS
jgi:hypothetical protein